MPMESSRKRRPGPVRQFIPQLAQRREGAPGHRGIVRKRGDRHQAVDLEVGQGQGGLQQGKRFGRLRAELVRIIAGH